MRRGEVWWARLPPPAGRRPILLLSRDAAYDIRTSITVAPVSRTIRDIPVEVVLDKSDGMPVRCVASLDDVTTIPKSMLDRRITMLSRAQMDRVAEAIRFALDLP
jgi:mRNA interferase MazF